ncbi:hypothetical protein [Sedimentitalea todarodis]|uniref:Uncharacterized protein n=1 Tax=Sedimentitalea todarodis TaxID=1631240 RepID=A0ABU3VHC0_9RHOB|nr:hypothetical protein [Sedimentitalea todarodis]MDU9005488.1 hypothetical protein [Sedimentitalea todarodis]
MKALRTIRIFCAGLTLVSATAVLPDPGLATALDACGPHRATIHDLADRIISEKARAEGFSGHSFGAAAAYLSLRYSDADLDPGMSLLARVKGGTRRPPRGLEQVQLAFAISKLGVEQGIIAVGRSTVDAFADYSPAIIRQILLADAGESFFRLLAEVRADSTLAENFEARYYDGLGVHGWVLDQSDDFKLRLARNAEAAKELALAAMVLGSRRELAEYHVLLERHRDTDLAEVAGPKWLNAHLATMVYQTTPVPVPGDSADDSKRRADQFDIMRAAFRMGGLGWLGLLYNQTGAEAAIARASRDFLAEIDAGRLDPQSDLEPAWAYLYGRLAQELGAGILNRSMSGFSLPRSVRHYADDAQTTLNWVNARQALIPYMTGTEDALPPRPALLTPEFDWKAWTTLAAALRTEPDSASDDTNVEPRIAAELLLAKGNVAQALDVARSITPNTDRLWFYRDVMIRLDRHCDGYTTYSGAELVMGGAILFGFD